MSGPTVTDLPNLPNSTDIYRLLQKKYFFFALPGPALNLLCGRRSSIFGQQFTFSVQNIFL
jgi:hypothetical protein